MTPRDRTVLEQKLVGVVDELAAAAGLVDELRSTRDDVIRELRSLPAGYRPTLSDVAEFAGVSRQIVRRVEDRSG